MPLSEFDLIGRYFSPHTHTRGDVVLGVGDDAALLRVAPDQAVLTALCTLVAGRHFTARSDPAALGHRALAIPLSRLAAAGAAPAWCSLALTMPTADEAWLGPFSRGLLGTAERFSVQLVGGDTTRGPMAVTVHCHGLVPRAEVVGDGGAHPGDLIYVTGILGDAGLALLSRQNEVRLPGREKAYVEHRLERPEPRISAGRALRGLASAVVDLPDGLAAGLGTLLRARGLGATLYAQQLPISNALRSVLEPAGGWILPLTAGGDYELCFTLPSDRQVELERRLPGLEVTWTWIGTVDRRAGLRCLLDDGSDIAPG